MKIKLQFIETRKDFTLETGEWDYLYFPVEFLGVKSILVEQNSDEAQEEV